MRIRYPFAVAFAIIALISAYLGLSSLQVPQVNDKALHFVAFFLLTLTFYWIFDTGRRRVLNLTLVTVTLGFSVASEGAQWFTTARQFDTLDIAANILGSLAALGLCTMYHKRMLERRRQAKGYGMVAQTEEDVPDVEMGQVDSQQQTGVVEISSEATENNAGGSADNKASEADEE